MPVNGRVGEKSPLLAGGSSADASDVQCVDATVLPSSTVIEPPNQARSRWRSIRIMYFTMFMSSVTFTMTMPTLWPYLQVVDKSATPSLLGWVVASYSVGQLVASPCFGLWSARRQAREPLVVSLLLQVGSNLFYAYMQSVSSDHGGGYLVVARVLMGLASGNAAVVRAYVSGATTLQERTGAMTMVSIWQSIGFILGPVIQTALVSIGYPGPLEKVYLHVNMYTTPAFIAALLAIANFLLLIIMFRLHTVSDTGPINAAVNCNDEVEEEEEKNDGFDDGPPDYLALFTTMYLFFNVFFMFTIFETIGTPLVMDMYGWVRSQAALYIGIMLAVAGLLAVGVFVVVKILSQKGFDERKLLISGFTFCLIGYGIYLPWGNLLPVIGYAPLYTAATPSTTTPTSQATSRTIAFPWQQDRQSAWQREGKQLSQRERSDVSTMFLNDALSAVQYEKDSGYKPASQQDQGFYSKLMVLTNTSGTSSEAKRTDSGRNLNSKSGTNSPSPAATAVTTRAAVATDATTTSAEAAVTSTTTHGSNTTNSTTDAEGCPWEFGWCGKVPRVRLFQFILGTVFIAVGYPIVNVMTYSLFSKVLGPQPQGLWMGFLTACGSLARTLGPIFVAQIYDAWGPRVTFASTCAILAVTIGINCATYRRLVPFATSSYRKRSSDQGGGRRNGSVYVNPTGSLQ